MDLEVVNSTHQVSVLNSNFQEVEDWVNDKGLDRTDASPMESNLDMNGNRVYNLPKPISDNEPARLKDLKDAGGFGGEVSSGVSTFNTREGDVVLADTDVTNALGYTPASVFSPSFSGTPTAPTASTATNNSQVATTAFVKNVVATGVAGVSSFNTRSGAVTLNSADVATAIGYEPIGAASPSLTGVPTAPTAAPGTNTTQLATTSFVQNAVTASTTGVASFNTRTGSVTLSSGDVTSALGYTAASLNSPAFTGTPTAPTATSGDNTTKIATTAFVANAVSSSVSGVSSFNTRTGAVSLNAADVVTALEVGANAAPLSIDTTAASPTSSSIYLNRTASYSGGTVGHVNSALFVDTTVSAGATSFEWGITSRVNNSAIASENVGVYGQGNKLAKGGTWGGCFEVCDMTYTATPSDGGSVVGAEVDVWCNGSDDYEKRIGVDVVVGNASFMRTGSLGPKGYAYDGVRVGAFGNNHAHGAFLYGINIMSADQAGIVNQANGVRGIFQKGTYQVGIDLAQSTNTDSAIRIKANDWIAFDGSSQFKMRYNSSNGLLEFFNNTSRKGYINITSGADVDLAGGSGGSYVDLSSTQTIGGNKTFTSYTYLTGGVETAGISIRPYNTINWASAGVISGSAGSLSGYITIGIDGAAYKIPFYNA